MNSQLIKELSLITAAAGLAMKSRRMGWLAAGLWLVSMAREFSFRGKRVYITGGSRGLGLSIAWNALRRGAQVTIVAREDEELRRAKEILLGAFPSGQVWTDVCDVTDGAELEASLNKAIAAMSGLDVLVNNAGSILVGPARAMELEDYEAQMRLHLFAVIRATNFVVDHFRRQGGGRILNICSVGGKVGVPHMLPYDASKFALAGFSQGVCAELAPYGVRVTTAYPAVMRTGSPIQAVFKGDHEAEFEWFQALDILPGLSMSADAAAKKVLDAVEQGRSEAVLSIPARARVFLGAMLPETMNTLMAIAARFMPKGEARERKTGAESVSSFEHNRHLRFLKERAHDAEAEYNQAPHFDAEHAMGLKPDKLKH